MDDLITYIEKNVFPIVTQGTLFNQYNQTNLLYDSENAQFIRRNNLKAYVSQLIYPIDVMFIGIAPGAKGCRFSGVPFTSEKVLLTKKSNFFKTSLYSKSSRSKPYTENSSTKVWKSFSNFIPSEMLNHIFMWNVVPFHTEGATPLLNRDPSLAELQKYSKIALDIIRIVQPKKIYCFGRSPYEILSEMLGKDVTYIPHPSRASYETLKIAYSHFI